MGKQKAYWAPAEETQMLKTLFQHRSEAGDSSNFVSTIWQAVLTAIGPFYVKGAAKSVQSCQIKWRAVSPFPISKSRQSR